MAHYNIVLLTYLLTYSRCCLIHKPQQTKFPAANDPKWCKLSFRSHHFEFPFSFYLVADFESFLKPVVDGDQQQSGAGRVINVDEPSRFCVHRVSTFPDYQTSPFTYSGANVIDAFYDHVLHEARSISDILSRNVPICVHSTAINNRRLTLPWPVITVIKNSRGITTKRIIIVTWPETIYHVTIAIWH